MSTGKQRLLRSVNAAVDGAKGVWHDGRASIANSRVTNSVDVPPARATVEVKLDYVEAARLTVARLEAPAEDGALGIAPPFLALCRAAVATHPELVDAVVEPLLAHRRRLG